MVLLLCSQQVVFGIRFVIDRQECFSHYVQYERDTVHVSFVVIKVDASWQYTIEGVDIVVRTMLIPLNHNAWFIILLKNSFPNLAKII